MSTLVVIIVILAVCCIFGSKLNALIEIGMALAIIFGVIYGAKSLFDLSWTTTGLWIIIFCLGAYLWERIK